MNMNKIIFYSLYLLCFALLLINCFFFAVKKDYSFDGKYSNIGSAIFVLVSMIFQVRLYKAWR